MYNAPKGTDLTGLCAQREYFSQLLEKGFNYSLFYCCNSSYHFQEILFILCRSHSWEELEGEGRVLGIGH